MLSPYSAKYWRVTVRQKETSIMLVSIHTSTHCQAVSCIRFVCCIIIKSDQSIYNILSLDILDINICTNNGFSYMSSGYILIMAILSKNIYFQHTVKKDIHIFGCFRLALIMDTYILTI